MGHAGTIAEGGWVLSVPPLGSQHMFAISSSTMKHTKTRALLAAVLSLWLTTSALELCPKVGDGAIRRRIWLS